MEYRNRYQNQKMTSEFVNTHGDITYSYEPMMLHSHPFYEVICCRSTCGAEYIIGPYRCPVQKGDILWIRPGVKHCVILPEKMTVPFARDVIWINKSFLTKAMAIIGVMESENRTTFLTRTAGTPWSYLCNMIHKGVLEEKYKQQGWELAVLGNTIHIVAHMRRARFSKSYIDLEEEKGNLLDEIIEYIDANYRKKLLKNELSVRFYVSERTISSLFRQKLGMTFTQYLTQRRLIAVENLIEGGMPLEEAAAQTGFADYSTFYRAFRRKYGYSPREIKRKGLRN